MDVGTWSFLLGFMDIFRLWRGWGWLLTFWIFPPTSTSCVSHLSTEKTLYSSYTWIEPTQGRWRWRSHVRTECDYWFRLAETWSKDHTIGPTTLLVYLLLEFPFGIKYLYSRYAYNSFLPNKLYKYLLDAKEYAADRDNVLTNKLDCVFSFFLFSFYPFGKEN